MTAGRLEIADRVVERIAARAVGEVPGATGRPGGVLHRRASSASVDGGVVSLEVAVAVDWPLPVRQTCAEVRSHVGARVTALTGLPVAQVDVRVAELVPPSAPARSLR